VRLIAVRHGETTLNREGRVVGHSPAGLTPKGRKQAEALAQALSREEVAAVYASPLPRAWETAQPIAARLGLEVRAEPAIKEADAGDLEGLPLPEMRQRYPRFLSRWREDPATTAMPGGESLGQVLERAWPVVERWREEHPRQTVVAVTHNFVIQLLLCRMLGLPLKAFRHLQIDLASLTEVEWREGGWVVVRLNDTCHLDSL